MPTVGFTIVSHGAQGQLQRLIEALDREYDTPPIGCHHDFGQAPLDTSAFGPNVRFALPHIPTRWCRFSVVQATLAALQALYGGRTPDWWVHLSASDYPVMSGARVRQQLAKAGCDAFLDARPTETGKPFQCNVVGTRNPKVSHFDSESNRETFSRFHLSREIWLPVIRKDPKLRIGRHTLRPNWLRAKVSLPCFFGDYWHMGNAKTASVLLNPTPRHLAFQKHLEDRSHCDETYFQTILANEPGLTICLDNKRFAEWNGGGAHPMMMGERQVEEALESGAFFARKFPHGSRLLDEIDRALLLRR